jgi:hypothetical protein
MVSEDSRIARGVPCTESEILRCAQDDVSDRERVVPNGFVLHPPTQDAPRRVPFLWAERPSTGQGERCRARQDPRLDLVGS